MKIKDKDKFLLKVESENLNVEEIVIGHKNVEKKLKFYKKFNELTNTVLKPHIIKIKNNFDNRKEFKTVYKSKHCKNHKIKVTIQKLC